MSKAVLISIRPKWCDLIARGKKTFEVRKTTPKLETPFKCYIYQTLPKTGDWNDKDGRVVGEFVCDRVEMPLVYGGNGPIYNQTIVEASCLTLEEILEYSKGKNVYAWHISKLWMYDTPKKLGEFKRHDLTYDFSIFGEVSRTYSINRPPQSWCYVEEM